MSHPILLLAAVLFALGSVACRPSTSFSQASTAAPAFGRAPEWRLRTIEGAEFGSKELAGKVAVVDFWATWCPPCVAEIPGYIELQAKYAKDGLVVVGVSLDEDGADTVSKFAEKNRMNYKVVMGDDALVKAFGGLEGIPTTFLVDRAGNIVHRKQGAMEREEYEKILLPYLK